MFKASVKNGKLTVTVPLFAPRPSNSSDKTLVVASTGGFKETTAQLSGKAVRVNSCAYIYKSDAHPFALTDEKRISLKDNELVITIPVYPKPVKKDGNKLSTVAMLGKAAISNVNINGKNVLVMCQACVDER